MVEKIITPEHDVVVDFARYLAVRNAVGLALAARICRHCGAALSEGEREDECSSAFNLGASALRNPPRKFYAD